jgi:exodeoxyribonuclease III
MTEGFSVATWNVNSINARLETARAVLKTLDADVVCLQELKCEDAKFPRAQLEDDGWNIITHGQKTYNGVAILSRLPITLERKALPDEPDPDQSRYLEAVVGVGGETVRVSSIYLPNGNPAPGPKYEYKLKWMEALRDHGSTLLALEEMTVLAGDYNVIPRPADVHDPKAWDQDALFLPETRSAFRSILNDGWTEAFMERSGAPHAYTFWDYQAGAWQRNNGIRIDHLLLSPGAVDRLEGVEIHRDARGLDKPSDHVPFKGIFKGRGV